MEYKNYKIINVALISFILYLIIKSSSLWLFLIDKLMPIFISFMVAYFIYPVFFKMNKKIPKIVCLFIFIIVFLLIIALFIIKVIPILSHESLNLIDYLIVFIENISNKYNINLEFIKDKLYNLFKHLFTSNISNILAYINTSIDILTNIIIVFIGSIYFLLDMDKIRLYIKKNVSSKVYLYLSLLDKEMNNYIKGFFNIILITFFEYTIVYFIIGYPNALLIGIMAAISNLVPCFGALIVQIIAISTSFALSYKYGILVLIITLILSIIDNYIINPTIYGKTNKIHPIIIIFSMFISNSIFGFLGFIIAIPLAIFLITTFDFFKNKLLKL